MCLYMSFASTSLKMCVCVLHCESLKDHLYVSSQSAFRGTSQHRMRADTKTARNEWIRTPVPGAPTALSYRHPLLLLQPREE